ncbi:MAG: alpha-galactosidase [Clostridia bacterium]|nr:alpha-galactosidase [Clostridia bacterium]
MPIVRHILTRRILCACLGLLLSAAPAGLAAPAALAQSAPRTTAQAGGGVLVSTRFPGVRVNPGERVNFSLTVTAQDGRSHTVALEAASVPQGWSAIFQGSGRSISEVFVSPQTEESLTLQVTVPADAKAGTYPIAIFGRTESGTARLTIALSVQEGAVSSGLVAQYAELAGPAGANFEFRVDLTNNTAQDQSYSLAATAPQGWRTEIKPSFGDRQIASISVKAGETQSLNVSVTPPEDVKAGDYPVELSATSAAGRMVTRLTVKITGTYKLELSTPDERLNFEATAGRETRVPLRVRNTGTSTVTNVRLSATPPSGWTVTFEPQTVGSIEPGQSADVVAVVTPSSQAIAGDYQVDVRAASENASDTASFRATVRTPTVWGLVGVVIVAAVVFGVLQVFRRYGRR